MENSMSRLLEVDHMSGNLLGIEFVEGIKIINYS